MATTKTKAAKNNKNPGQKPATPDYSLYEPFPSHVICRDWEKVDDLNDHLREALWRKRALDPEGVYRSNLAGTWHSKDDVFDTTAEHGTALKDMFARAMMQWASAKGLTKDTSVNMKMAAWAMIYSDRGYATVHTHPNCHVSGVYYVDDTTDDVETTMATGVKLKAGSIEFVNPVSHGHQTSLFSLNPSFIMPFKRGRMLVFPSSLAHFVHPIIGEGQRMSVACNASFYPVPERTTK